VLDCFCQGFNGTILAYGQTGSGKTYTMGTAATAKELAAAAARGGTGGGGGAAVVGVVPRAIARVFEYVQKAAPLYDCALTVTYVEIYNEQVLDLLAGTTTATGAGAVTSAHVTGGGAGTSGGGGAQPPSQGGAGGFGGGGGAVAIREGPEGQIILEGATEARVRSREEVASLLARGNERRAVGSHKLNEASSRSHAVLALALEQRARPGAGVPRELRYLRWAERRLAVVGGSWRQLAAVGGGWDCLVDSRWGVADRGKWRLYLVGGGWVCLGGCSECVAQTCGDEISRRAGRANSSWGAVSSGVQCVFADGGACFKTQVNLTIGLLGGVARTPARAYPHVRTPQRTLGCVSTGRSWRWWIWPAANAPSRPAQPVRCPSAFCSSCTSGDQGQACAVGGAMSNRRCKGGKGDGAGPPPEHS
jgi:hypothetical protein